MEAIFRVDGGRVEVSPNAAGPWDPRMQHGSAPAGLAVWAAEAIPTSAAMRVARVTVDLMRPVPLKTLAIETEVLREGRKIQLCAVRVRADGVLTVSATVLRVKLQTDDVPPDAGGPALTLPGPDQSPEDPAQFSNSPFVMGMQLRAARGTFGVRGPGAIWYRVKRPFVEGPEGVSEQLPQASCGRLFAVHGTEANDAILLGELFQPIGPKHRAIGKAAAGLTRPAVAEQAGNGDV